MTEVLLIQPPVRDFYQTALRTQPMGLMYLAAVLRQGGYTVGILDCQAAPTRQTVPYPDNFSYLREFYDPADKSPFKLFGHFYHFGMSWEDVRAAVRASDAKIFGIASIFTPYFREAEMVARIVKEEKPGSVVVVGGAHVNSMPEATLSSPWVDFIVQGEGEYRFLRLADKLLRGVGAMEKLDGVGYKNGVMKINRAESFIHPLDELPFPARDLIDPEAYQIGGKKYTMLVTSRGCPYRCTFCSINLTNGYQFRVRSPENILAEMEEARAKYGAELFDFEDDNLTFDMKRMEKLLDLIRERFGDEAFELTAMNGITFSKLDSPLLGKMRRAGFKRLNVALVSADKTVQKNIKRPGSNEEFVRVVAAAKKEGIHVTAYLILGMPEQTLDEMLDSILFLAAQPVLIGPSLFYATPKTAIYEQWKETYALDAVDKTLLRGSAMFIEGKDFTRLDLVTLFRLVRLINFLKEIRESGCGTEHDCPHAPHNLGRRLYHLFLAERRFFGARSVIARSEAKELSLRGGQRPTKQSPYFPFPTSPRVADLFFSKSQSIVSPLHGPKDICYIK